ncbi:AAA family ATPase [Aristaeella hokkaidonensis]|uniref:ATP-binding protein n=1 Tax=Aristaeella hokkaidonensis TaxID=3046382 RepID=A0AC61N2A7_9FIRM|nr:ATP-binding protein [Aristaeella hokkaidonensis]MBQ6289375.1 ATP-binding protein [Clostridia bacterium]QUC66585.1 ATP-binding protein [Aristaeella hokkaidonensis]SNT95174.1 Predicted kinase [Aristaeella hokkaidonensis]
MAKVIMTCGRICCGKSTYARKLQENRNAVVLSIDDITLTLFPEGAGEMHDTYVLRAEQYLLSLSLQILESGVDVILDWGLWTRAQRDRLRAFYTGHGVENEIHYLRLSPEEWERRIRKRNAEQNKEEPQSYYVDEGLLRKVDSLFEEPSDTETDLLIEA